MTILTHALCLMLGASLGVVVMALLVAAGGRERDRLVEDRSE